ncbi:MAG: hypothetical protein IAF94_24205 [Pirellulaceae bacterium]|nr:hypothetical protein [Pirellulaceae bacterium]
MKFSIRDLLLVTVIVALAVGWWVERARLAVVVEREKEREVLAEIMRMWNLPNSPAIPLDSPKNQAGPHPDP